jgi:hypothetical protein
MANYSLVYKTNSDVVIQIVTSEEEIFQVHEELQWVEGPEVLEEGKTSADYEYTESDGIKLKPDFIPAYDIERRFNYPDVTEQLDTLWHDMNSGSIPGKESSNWFKSIKDIKEMYPKE